MLSDKNKLGMVLFIFSEAIFFGLLLLAYLYFQGQPAQGPTAATALDPLTTGLFSILLVSSSFTIWRAEKSLTYQNPAGLQRWLLVTIIFGFIFLVGQGIEWRRLLEHDTTISRNLFGTTFFTLTGFHGLHVLIGLIALSIVWGLARTGDFKADTASAVSTLGLYWHFVDGVWVIIFSVVYLMAGI